MIALNELNDMLVKFLQCWHTILSTEQAQLNINEDRMFLSPEFDVSYVCCTNQLFHVKYKNTLTSFKANLVKNK